MLMHLAWFASDTTYTTARDVPRWWDISEALGITEEGMRDLHLYDDFTR